MYTYARVHPKFLIHSLPLSLWTRLLEVRVLCCHVIWSTPQAYFSSVLGQILSISCFFHSSVMWNIRDTKLLTLLDQQYDGSPTVENTSVPIAENCTDFNMNFHNFGGYTPNLAVDSLPNCLVGWGGVAVLRPYPSTPALQPWLHSCCYWNSLDFSPRCAPSFECKELSV